MLTCIHLATRLAVEAKGAMNGGLAAQLLEKQVAFLGFP